MSTKKPREMELAFRIWAGQQGLDLGAAVATRDLIGWMTSFYAAVGFARRKRGTMADMLLFQTGNSPAADGWTVNVTRQLYSRGRGLQLGLTQTLDGPFPGDVTLWSKDADSAEAWAEQALAALEALGPLPALPVALSLDAF